MMNATATATLADLEPGDFATINGREYRVVRHWPTGTEITDVASWAHDTHRVIDSATPIT